MYIIIIIIIIKALDSVHNLKKSSLKFQVFILSGRYYRKIANPGDKRRFCDRDLFAHNVAMFTHSALLLLSLQTWCQQGTVSEFLIWVMYLFTVLIKM